MNAAGYSTSKFGRDRYRVKRLAKDEDSARRQYEVPTNSNSSSSATRKVVSDDTSPFRASPGPFGFILGPINLIIQRIKDTIMQLLTNAVGTFGSLTDKLFGLVNTSLRGFDNIMETLASMIDSLGAKLISEQKIVITTIIEDFIKVFDVILTNIVKQSDAVFIVFLGIMGGLAAGATGTITQLVTAINGAVNAVIVNISRGFNRMHARLKLVTETNTQKTNSTMTSTVSDFRKGLNSESDRFAQNASKSGRETSAAEDSTANMERNVNKNFDELDNRFEKSYQDSRGETQDKLNSLDEPNTSALASRSSANSNYLKSVNSASVINPSIITGFAGLLTTFSIITLNFVTGFKI
jgi:hypothetical protein